MECREETYTAWKCEWTHETRPCTRTVMRPVCETVNEGVPSTETYTEMVPYTYTVRVPVGGDACGGAAISSSMGSYDGAGYDLVTGRAWINCIGIPEKD